MKTKHKLKCTQCGGTLPKNATPWSCRHCPHTKRSVFLHTKCVVQYLCGNPSCRRAGSSEEDEENDENDEDKQGQETSEYEQGDDVESDYEDGEDSGDETEASD